MIRSELEASRTTIAGATREGMRRVYEVNGRGLTLITYAFELKGGMCFALAAVPMGSPREADLNTMLASIVSR